MTLNKLEKNLKHAQRLIYSKVDELHNKYQGIQLTEEVFNNLMGEIKGTVLCKYNFVDQYGNTSFNPDSYKTLSKSIHFDDTVQRISRVLIQTNKDYYNVTDWFEYIVIDVILNK